MKRETYANKLAALLGLDESLAPKPEPKKSKHRVLAQGVTLEEEEKYRGAQATAIFLLAPELFKPVVCKRCGEHFIVSRTLVAFCSYHCTKLALQESGIDWNPKIDAEYIRRVWEDNEPLRVPPAAVKVLMEIIKQDT